MIKELEQQRVARIALDHALQLQEAATPPPRPRTRCVKIAAATLAGVAATGVAATAVLTSVPFIP